MRSPAHTPGQVARKDVAVGVGCRGCGRGGPASSAACACASASTRGACAGVGGGGVAARVGGKATERGDGLIKRFVGLVKVAAVDQQLGARRHHGDDRTQLGAARGQLRAGRRALGDSDRAWRDKLETIVAGGAHGRRARQPEEQVDVLDGHGRRAGECGVAPTGGVVACPPERCCRPCRQKVEQVALQLGARRQTPHGGRRGQGSHSSGIGGHHELRDVDVLPLRAQVVVVEGRHARVRGDVGDAVA